MAITGAFGAQSMTAPLRRALVARPGHAFARAFETPELGFRHSVEVATAQREHDEFVDLLQRLGVEVERLPEAATERSADSIYTYDPALVTDRGAIGLRSAKPNRLVEVDGLLAWTARHGIPTIGQIEAPGTVDGGDTFWLRPDLLCVGRSLRTNDAGARQLTRIVGGDVRTFDLPYWRGPAELVHLLSVVSLVADDLAVVYRPLLPAGLFQLLCDLDVRLVDVPDDEFETLACNVLAIRPGVCVVVDGNPRTRRALERAACEVHAFRAAEIGLNGSGGPTCLTRPLLRA